MEPHDVCQPLAEDLARTLSSPLAVDDLNIFMNNNHLPDTMRVRLRRYFHQRKNLQMMKAAGEVVGKLSSSLQVEGTRANSRQQAFARALP